MVKDKIIQMDNGKNYYVVEELEYEGKKYLLSLECDINNDTVKEDEYYVMELAFNNNDLVIKRVEDDNIAQNVTVMLLNKIRNNFE